MEFQVIVIIGETHSLQLPACVFFAGSQIWIVTQNDCIAQLPLFSARVNVHIVDIECILCIAFMCRGSIEYKDSCGIGIGVVEDCDCVLNLFDQLGKVLPTVKPLPGYVIFRASNAARCSPSERLS